MKREISRIREQGTVVTAPESGQERIDAIRQIVERHQYAKVDGIMVDGFSASAIIRVYDAISPENQQKYAGFHVARMADVAFKLMK